MIPFELDIPAHVVQIIRKLPPDVKKSVKEALRALSDDPSLGERLKGELEGLWRYKVRRYRIVYLPDDEERMLYIYAVGHRKEVYDKVKAP